MKQIELGQSGIMVPDWCLGTMTFGTQTDVAGSHAQIDMALDHGLNFVDTAEMYPVNPVRAETVGRTEEIIGDWLEKTGRRGDIILATKAGGDSQMVRGGEGYGPESILRILDGNLNRLKTDYIDVYQLHWPMRGSYMFRQNWTYDPSGQDRQKTLDHMAGVLEKLGQAQKAGKIRAFGMSNESAWGCTRWIDVAEQVGGPRMATVQNEYSLLCRMYDADMAEMAVNEKVTLLSFSPLATGLLTGKYQDGAVPEDSRMSLNGNLGGRKTPRAFEAVGRYLDLARDHGLDPVHMAMAWQRSRPFPISAIFGATTIDQLAHILRGKDMELSPEVTKEIDRINKAIPMPY
ncbi:aldo/keto reductase [Loktanella sp. IMCC34160]|uniref:aldo/keto reductase n=1 Tax=Loktanella sp. IMCC34160 TaxID=2510646 RepID=UPI00101CFC98|nr:aldo/keto reductase [Loktanella sp. IMCC34160]RYG89345.1 aldo/keto reductase [Loktanella sp. IMCC34160]